jgi:hypothetical protein
MNQNISPEERENISEVDLWKKRRKSNIVALIACTLIAFVLWLAIRNATDVNETPTLPPATDQVAQQNS